MSPHTGFEAEWKVMFFFCEFYRCYLGMDSQPRSCLRTGIRKRFGRIHDNEGIENIGIFHLLAKVGWYSPATSMNTNKTFLHELKMGLPTVVLVMWILWEIWEIHLEIPFGWPFQEIYIDQELVTILSHRCRRRLRELQSSCKVQWGSQLSTFLRSLPWRLVFWLLNFHVAAAWMRGCFSIKAHGIWGYLGCRSVYTPYEQCKEMFKWLPKCHPFCAHSAGGSTTGQK